MEWGGVGDGVWVDEDDGVRGTVLYDGWRTGVCITGLRGIGIGFAWSLWVLGVKVSGRVLVLEGLWDGKRRLRTTVKISWMTGPRVA